MTKPSAVFSYLRFNGKRFNRIKFIWAYLLPDNKTDTSEILNIKKQNVNSPVSELASTSNK